MNSPQPLPSSEAEYKMQPNDGEHVHLDMDPRPARLHPVFIPDDAAVQASADRHLFPTEYSGHLDKVMIENTKLMNRCKELAKLINEDYQNEREYPFRFFCSYIVVIICPRLIDHLPLIRTFQP